jgi:nucleotide-binding universal stress UspA family protein
VFTHILVPLDGSEYSERAVEPACSLAEKYSARLTLMTVMLRFPGSRLYVPTLDQGAKHAVGSISKRCGPPSWGRRPCWWTR